MARKPKCQICKMEIDKEKDEWIKNSTGYFHVACREQREDLRKHRIVSCIVCGKKIDRKSEEYISILGGYAHKTCDISNLISEASKDTIKTYKCHYCGQIVIREKAVQKGKFYFHQECLKEHEDRAELFNYCCKLWGLKSPGPTIIRQAKTFRDKGYTYRSMMFTLKFFYEIRHNDPNKYKGNETIGIIPYIYEDAKRFYEKLSEQRKEIAGQLVEQQKQLVETHKVKVEQKKKKPKYDF